MDFFNSMIGINLFNNFSKPKLFRKYNILVDQIGRSGFSIPYLMEVYQLVEPRTFPQYLIFKPAM